MTYIFSDRMLRASVLVYALASLAHHVHNAENLNAYPQMPESLTRVGVYAAWTAVTLVGVTGYAFVHAARPRTGLALLALYAALGWYGLAHYVIAPFGAHSAAMNATILMEVLAATVLAAVVAQRLYAQFRLSDSPR